MKRKQKTRDKRFIYRRFVQQSLRFLSSAILKRYKPKIIAITGSVGKTSTREAVFKVLSQKFHTRCNQKNYNTEVGVPLTIIGVKKEPARSFFRWAYLFFKAVRLIVVKSRRYPRILVLELAADRPGDIKHFMSFIQPHISIITTISHVHLENFAKFNQLIAEKRQIIENLPREGYAVLNLDDEYIRDMASKIKARNISYGLSCRHKKDSRAIKRQNSAVLDVTAQDVKVIKKANQIGLYFKLLYKDTATPIFVSGMAAKHQIYSLLAAAACGLVYKMTPVEIAQGLEQFKPLQGRFVVRRAQNGVWLIDDTYNAAPVSTCAALESLRALPVGQRKIAVLSDMLELGSFEERGHSQVGRCVADKLIALLLTYGRRGRLISQGALSAGMPKERVCHFDDQGQLIKYLRAHLRSGDVVLIKGSHQMKMRNVVEALLK